MNRNVVLVLLILVVSFSNAQTKVIENIVKFKTKNTGTFLDVNNNADGYYFFYEVDKLKKGQREFAIEIIDKNLNSVATKKMVASKKTVLIGSAFNNQKTLFAFFDYNLKTVTIKGFDKKANFIEDKVINLSKQAAKRIYGKIKIGQLQNPITPIKNVGFLLNLPYYKNNSYGHSFNFYPTNTSFKEWNYKKVSPKNWNHNILPASTNENFIVLIDVKRKGTKLEYSSSVIDTKSGEFNFENMYDANDPKLISNAFLTSDGNIATLGQYYKPKAKIMKAKSLGLYIDVFNAKGEKVFEKKNSWEVDVNRLLPVKKENKLEDIGYIYFHDIIKTQNGGYYAVGEQYRKTISASAVAVNIIGGLLGGGVSTNSLTQLTIKDAYFFKFDEKFNLNKIEVFKKGTSRIQNLYDYGSPQFSAILIKATGGFDYVYSQIDKKRDRFYANFIDYERGDKEVKSNLVFKTIIYDEGELSEDKISLNNKTTSFEVLPGKVGTVLLLEHDKRKKQIRLHLEKLNIK